MFNSCTPECLLAVIFARLLLIVAQSALKAELIMPPQVYILMPSLYELQNLKVFKSEHCLYMWSFPHLNIFLQYASHFLFFFITSSEVRSMKGFTAKAGQSSNELLQLDGTDMHMHLHLITSSLV